MENQNNEVKVSKVKTDDQPNTSKQTTKNSRKKFKMPSSLTIIVGVLFAIIIFTWLVDWGGGTYEVGRVLNPGDVLGVYGSQNEAQAAIDTINSELQEVLGNPDLILPLTAVDLNNDGTWEVIWAGPVIDIPSEKKEVQAMGLLTFGQAMSSGFADAASLIFYLFILGAIIEIMLVSGSLEAGVSALVKGFNGKELLLIPLLVVIFSAGGTIYGMQEETIGLFIIIVPTLALAGFDTVTGLLVILLGTTTGFAASTVNPFSVGAAVDAAGVAEASIGNGLVFRLFWWIVLTSMAASAITAYAAWVRKNPEKSFNKQMHDEAEEWLDGFRKKDEVKATKKQIAAVWVFMITFLIMVIMFIPWTDLFGFSYPAVPFGLRWLFGGLNGPGLWYFEELSMLFIVSGVIISLILGMGIEKTSKSAWNGAKDMLSVAIVIGVARSIPYILEISGTQFWLVQGLSGPLENLSPIGFVYVMFFIFLLLALLVPSTSGLASLSMGIFMPLAVSVANGNGVDPEGLTAATIMVFVLATGIINMFAPTQAVVMASTSASHVSYGDAMKPVLTFAGGMIVVSLLLIIPSTAVLF